ncbi:uncharacterized protein V1510DRAFT_278463 [Dipodascopsis tothii]|uniref:uncharacterized protein n=1 Tax=Dipodascopsis tothii TaxID=44089 RepID=UPI0034CF2822
MNMSALFKPATRLDVHPHLSSSDWTPGLDDLAPRRQDPSKDREYQKECVNVALNRNIILVLGNGLGKTYIAGRLLEAWVANERRQAAASGKPHRQAFFILPTKHMNEEKATTLGMFDFKLGNLINEDFTAFTEREVWENRLRGHEVVMVTPAVMCQFLDNNLVEMNQTLAMVVDECHHTTKLHRANRLFDFYHSAASSTRPRILGLTSYPLKTRTLTPEGIQARVNNLCQRMNSSVLCPNVSVRGLGSHPGVSKGIRDKFSQVALLYCTDRADALDDVVLNNIDLGLALAVLRYNASAASELGQWFVYQACLHYYNRDCQLEQEKSEQDLTETLALGVKETLEKRFPHGVARTDMSDKIKKLVNLIRQKAKGPEFRCVVFVEHRLTASLLCKYLNEGDSDQIRADFVTSGIPSNCRYFDFEMPRRRQTDASEQFRLGATNVLIMTLLLEETIELTACDLVVHLQLPHMFPYAFSTGLLKDSGECAVFVNAVDNSTYTLIRKYETSVKSTFQHLSRLSKATVVSRRLSNIKYRVYDGATKEETRSTCGTASAGSQLVHKPAEGKETERDEPLPIPADEPVSEDYSEPQLSLRVQELPKQSVYKYSLTIKFPTREQLLILISSTTIPLTETLKFVVGDREIEMPIRNEGTMELTEEKYKTYRALSNALFLDYFAMPARPGADKRAYLVIPAEYLAMPDSVVDSFVNRHRDLPGVEAAELLTGRVLALSGDGASPQRYEVSAVRRNDLTTEPIVRLRRLDVPFDYISGEHFSRLAIDSSLKMSYSRLLSRTSRLLPPEIDLSGPFSMVPSIIFRLQNLLLVSDISRKTDIDLTASELLRACAVDFDPDFSDDTKIAVYGGSILNLAVAVILFAERDNVSAQKYEMARDLLTAHVHRISAFARLLQFSPNSWYASAGEASFKSKSWQDTMSHSVDALVGAVGLTLGVTRAIECALQVIYRNTLFKEYTLQDLIELESYEAVDLAEDVDVASDTKVADVAERAGYQFRSRKLALAACRHYPDKLIAESASLLRLGRAVMDHICCRYLLEKFTEASLEQMALMKVTMTTDKILALAGRQSALVELSGQDADDSATADLVCSLLAAIYVDAGLAVAPCVSYLRRVYFPYIESADILERFMTDREEARRHARQHDIEFLGYEHVTSRAAVLAPCSQTAEQAVAKCTPRLLYRDESVAETVGADDAEVIARLWSAVFGRIRKSHDPNTN